VKPYLRKWTCVQYNFSNDSLKIVCLNSRWIKTSPRSLAPSDPGSDSKEPKHAKAEVLSVDASCKSHIVAETAATTTTTATPTSTSEAVARTPAKRLDFSTGEKAPKAPLIFKNAFD